MDRFDDLTRRIGRALKTPRQARAEQQARWERRQAFLPDYRARDVLFDSRGLFTPADELSKMDVLLARHGRLVTEWRSKYPRLVIDLRAARRDLEEKIRAEGLTFLERALVRRNFRATVSLLQTQGARRSYVSGTLSFNSRQKALYRFGELKPSDEAGRGLQATGRTQALVDEARRQSGPCPSGQGAAVLRYEPGRDPRLGAHAELKRLQEAGLAEREGPGHWRLDGRILATKLRERRPALLSVATLQRLRAANGPQSQESGFKRAAAADTATRQALAELETCYPRASRSTAQGYQVNAPQLRKALYADRARFVEGWTQESPAAADCDHRLAQALAASIVQGEQAVYHPDQDSSGNAAQTTRYLRTLALRRDQPAVRLGRGGSFLIDRPEAVKLLNRHREALLTYERRLGEPPSTLAPSVIAAFTRHGEIEREGSWRLTARHDLVSPALVWRLHQSVAFHPTAIQQLPDGSYRLSLEAARAHALPGTPEWAERMSERHQGLEQRTRKLSPPDFLSVALKDERAPLSDQLSPTTQATYAWVARRQRRIPLQERPSYLIRRADELKRGFWWLEHTVMRRELRALELAAGKNETLRRQCYELRAGIEAMDYQVLRQKAEVRLKNPARQAVAPEVIRDLKAELRARGDQELHDALVISEATGLRPGELARGVKLEQKGPTVYVHIQGGKRHSGVKEAEARFQVERGADRVIEVKSPEVSELAKRHQGYFRPESSADALRFRLREARAEIPGGETLRFYSFRHALKNRLEIEGHSREDIARIMGHRSTRSQENYRVEK